MSPGSSLPFVFRCRDRGVQVSELACRARVEQRPIPFPAEGLAARVQLLAGIQTSPSLSCVASAPQELAPVLTELSCPSLYKGSPLLQQG